MVRRARGLACVITLFGLATSAAAQGARPSVVEVVVVAPAWMWPLLDAPLRRPDVSLVFREPGAEPEATPVALMFAEDERGVALTLTTPGEAPQRWRFDDPRGGEVGRSAAVEAAVLTASSLVAGLLADGALVSEQPRQRTEAAEAPPAELPSDPRPGAREPSRSGREGMVELIYAGQGIAERVAHGGALGLGLAWRGAVLRLRVAAFAPVEGRRDEERLRLTIFEGRLEAGWRVAWEAGSVSVVGAVAAVPVRRETVASAEVATARALGLDVTCGAVLRSTIRLVGPLRLTLGAGLDVALRRQRYVALQRGGVVREVRDGGLWRPRWSAGVAWVF